MFSNIEKLTKCKESKYDTVKNNTKEEGLIEEPDFCFFILTLAAFFRPFSTKSCFSIITKFFEFEENGKESVFICMISC